MDSPRSLRSVTQHSGRLAPMAHLVTSPRGPHAAPPPWSAPAWQRHTSKALGISQVILGVVIILVQTAIVLNASMVGLSNPAILCAILFICTGSFSIGVGAANSPSNCMVTTLIVLSICSAVVTAILVSFASIGLTLDASDPGLHNTLPRCNPLRDPRSLLQPSIQPQKSITIPTIQQPADITLQITTASSSSDTTDSTVIYPAIFKRGLCENIWFTYDREKILSSLHMLMLIVAAIELVLAVITSVYACATKYHLDKEKKHLYTMRYNVAAQSATSISNLNLMNSRTASQELYI